MKPRTSDAALAKADAKIAEALDHLDQAHDLALAEEQAHNDLADHHATLAFNARSRRTKASELRAQLDPPVIEVSVR